MPMTERTRILLADDEPSIIKMVGKRLEIEGFEVLVAMDGQKALQRAQEESPDLIILDLMLPKLSGYTVCTTLKQDVRYQKIPIVMFSAKAQEKDEQLGLACGANAYLRKPFKAQELLEQIRALIGGAPAEGSRAGGA